jgi:two-component system, chemotaxis family, chemotaxis protein CheY
MKIMVVDDSGTMRNIVQKTLCDLGYKDLLLCDSGEKALETLEKEKPDLILLDWHMGGLSGLETLRIIKSNDRINTIPIIMLTVEQHSRSVAEALGSGAADYMVKPVNPILLREKVEKYTLRA